MEHWSVGETTTIIKARWIMMQMEMIDCLIVMIITIHYVHDYDEDGYTKSDGDRDDHEILLLFL